MANVRKFNIALMLTACWAASVSAAESLPDFEGGRLTTRMGFDSASYFASSRLDQALELGLMGELRGESSGFKGSFQGRYVVNWAQSLAVELPEGYYWVKPGEVEISVGRKLNRWSRLDEDWELGLFQPRFRWDYLHPTQTGLTGVFGEFRRGGVRVTAFGSYFYVPERGASVWADGGALHSSSPWFIAPPRLARFAGVATPVAYGLEVPPLEDILFRFSGAVQVEVGTGRGPWFSAALARKPVNQMLFGVSGHYALVPELIQATIHPRVLGHDIATLEGGYELSGMRLRLSLLYERPIRDNTPLDWKTQEASTAKIVSPGVSVPFSRDSGVSVSYLAVWGGNAPDKEGALAASGGASIFDERYPFVRAVKVRGYTGIPGPWGRRISGQSSVTADLGNDERPEPGRGLIWSTELRYASRDERGVAVAVGADILAADSSVGDTSFISRYRANHRLHAGVSYAF